MLSDVRAVLFDLDGTLLDRRGSFARFVREQWSRYNDVLDGVDQEEYVRELVARDRDGYAPRDELFTGIVSRLEVPGTLARTLLDDYRSGFPGACVLFADATDTLFSLRAAGLRLGLITNGSVRMQSAKLAALAISPLFDTILISDAEGMSKPQREIFDLALQPLGVNRAHAVFVGDHPEVDMAGARAAGMRAVWRRDATVSRVVECDAIIEDLADLLSLVGVQRLRTGSSH